MKPIRIFSLGHETNSNFLFRITSTASRNGTDQNLHRTQEIPGVEWVGIRVENRNRLGTVFLRNQWVNLQSTGPES